MGAVRCALNPGDAHADDAFSRALALDDWYAGAWSAKAKCLLGRRDEAGALAAARRAAELDPSADGAHVLLARSAGRDPATRSALIALTETAGDRVAAWDALASWSEAHGDVALWARALEALVTNAPARRDAVAQAAEDLAGNGEIAEARAVAGAVVDAADEPLAEQRHPLAARLAIDEAIARNDSETVRRRASRGRVGLEEASARALLGGQRDMAREIASTVALADPGASGARLVLAASDSRDVVGAAWDARRRGARASGAAYVAFGAAAAHALSREEAHATLVAIAHGAIVAGDDRVVRAAVELVSRGMLETSVLSPDGLVELAVLRGSSPVEGSPLPDPRSLDVRHEYLASALADPQGATTKELGARLASVVGRDPVVAAAAALVLIGTGAAIEAGAPRALLMRDPGDPLLAATALRLANKTGDSDVASRARATLTALGGLPLGGAAL